MFIIRGLICSMNPWNDVNSQSIRQEAPLKGNIQVVYTSGPQPPERGPKLVRGSFPTRPHKNK